MRFLEKKIKKLIIKAAIYNEAAHRTCFREIKHYCYEQKECYMDAYNILKNCKHSSIIYKKERVPDQNGNPSNLYYFEWYEKDNFIQLSFHKPLNKGKIYTFVRGKSSLTWTTIKNESMLKKLKINVEKEVSNAWHEAL